MQRSATSVISLSTETARSTRASSPAASIASTNARRLSSGMVEGADAAAQQLVADRAESGIPEPPGEGVRAGKIAHRLWQVGIGVPMFRHRAAAGGEPAAKVEPVRGARRGD